MSTLTNNPWPLSGRARLALRIIWMLVFCSLLFLYVVSFSISLDYARPGVVGLIFDKPENGSAMVEAKINGGPADQAGVKVGDTIVQIDGFVVKPETTIYEIVDRVRGESGTKVSFRMRDSNNQEYNLTIQRGQNLEGLADAWVELAQTLIFFLAGLIIFLKWRGSGYALLLSPGLILFGLSLSGMAELNDTLWQFLSVLGMISILLILLTYSNGSFVPSWSILIGILEVIIFGLLLFPAPWNPYSWPDNYFLWADWILFGAGLACLFYRYRRVASQTERRPVLWLLWGATITMVGFIIVGVLYKFSGLNTYYWLYANPPVDMFIGVIIALAYLAIPVSLMVPLFQKEANNLSGG